MIKAVIFDIDGTLVDSVDMHAQAWKEAFEHFGKKIPFDEVRHQIGKGGDQLMPVFFSKEELADGAWRRDPPLMRSVTGAARATKSAS